MNLKPIIKPVLNNFPFLYDVLKLGTKGSNSARYCYSVWLRHLARCYEAGFERPRVLAELGPGDSLGVGFSALLTGTDRYYALDTRAYAAADRNLAVFEEIADFLRNKVNIPHDEEYPEVQPKLNSYVFPAEMISDETLERALRPERLEAIRGLIRHPGENKGLEITYKAPWNNQDIIGNNSVDMIIAQAVMEHVDDIALTYSRLFLWLKAGGLLSLDIDFKAHNTTWEWNGHYGVPDGLWRFIRGKREWGINRILPSEHIAHIKNSGFEIIIEEAVKKPGGISRKKLSDKFKDISEEDLATAQMYILARKK